MAKAREIEGKNKEIFFDFFFLRSIYKDKSDKLDDQIKKITNNNIQNYFGLLDLFSNRFIEKIFICMVSSTAQIKNKRNFYNVILRFQFSKIYQDYFNTGEMFGVSGDLDPNQNIINVKSIFVTKQESTALPFETLISQIKSNVVNSKNVTAEELASRNIINSSTIDDIGIMLSNFELQKNQWMEYIDFKNDLAKLRKDNSLAYVNNKIIDEVLKVDTKTIPKDFREDIKKYIISGTSNSVYLKKESEYFLQLNNLSYENTKLIKLSIANITNQQLEIENFIKLGTLYMVPLRLNLNIESIIDLKNEYHKISKVNFDINNTQFLSIELGNYAGKKDGGLLTDLWRQKDNFVFGKIPKEEKLKAIPLINESKIVNIFFEIGEDIDEKILSDSSLDGLENGYISSINFGDEVLTDRSAKILSRISKGRVKNPYLANYLFNTSLIQVNNNYENDSKEEIKFKFELNNGQKEAVKKALNSKDIFLLQGPPGTGKTQVISEIVYQLAKKNKKVLISSQNHEAIDNVLERLPFDPDLIKIRNQNDLRKNKGNYYSFSPERLTYNYYKSVNKSIMSNIEYDKNLLADTTAEVKKLDKFSADYLSFSKVLDLININNETIKDIDEKIEKYKNNKNKFLKHQEEIEETKFYFKNILSSYINFEFDFFIPFDNTELKSFYENFSQNINDLYFKIFSNEDNLDYKDKIERINLNLLNNTIYKNYIEILKKYNIEKSQDEKNRYKDLLLKLNSEIKKDANSFEFINLIYKFINNINLKISSLSVDKNKSKEYDQEIDALKAKRFQIQNEIDKLNSSSFSNIKLLQNQLDNYNFRYKTNFKLGDNDLIVNLKNNLKNFEEIKQNYIENKNNLDSFYDEINNYLNNYYNVNESEISSKNFNINMKIDSKKYNSDILENMANVFAFTLTSKTKFNYEGKYEQELGIDSIDYDELDVDVVIIDEASKATMTELIMPLVYGKSLILVGDYRQLPPTFTLRQNEVDLVNETYSKNYEFDKFENILRNSLFKKLIISAKESINHILNQQYRSSSQIMEIVNLFYDGYLKMDPKLNNSKNHFLDIKSSQGNSVISPNRSVYWIDSSYDVNSNLVLEQTQVNSTSIFNQNEIEITMEMIKKINANVDENLLIKPTLAIISFYGLHVGKLKKAFNNIRKKINNVNVIINTVDDFQGKEAEYVIVNMVRNPKNLMASSRDFIKKYERINVAFSRAQKLLVIVGSERTVKNVKVQIPRVDNPAEVITTNVYDDILIRVKAWGTFLNSKDIFE